MTDGQRLVFFDLETGGLDPKRHPIIQVAAVAIDELLNPIEAFEAKIRFSEAKATRNSLRKNHYRAGVWAKDAKDETRVAQEFSEFLTRHATIAMTSAKGHTYHIAQLVAHNAPFDKAFLDAWFRRLDIFLPARHQVLCTLQRAIWHFTEHSYCASPRDYKLATLCEYFGVPFHAAAAHEALCDVIATLRLYRALQSETHNDPSIRPDNRLDFRSDPLVVPSSSWESASSK